LVSTRTATPRCAAAAKPSALDEYVKDAKPASGSSAAAASGGAAEDAATVVAGVPRLAAPEDSLVLEDAGARVALAGLDAGPLVTGVVLAVRGRVGEGDVVLIKGRRLERLGDVARGLMQ
jgi:hypothetical protein